MASIAQKPAYESGRPVLAVVPDCVHGGPADGEEALDTEAERRIREETTLRLLDLLLTGARDVETVGRRAVLLAHQLHVPASPKTQRALGQFMHLAPSRVNKLLTRFRRNLARIDRDG